MKLWNFEAKNNPKEISNKLESALKTAGFVFNTNCDENNSVTFKVRKRILYAWYMAFQNWTIVNGKLVKTDNENSTDVEISFNQHFLIKLIVFTHISLILGLLIAIIAGINSSPTMYIFGGLILALGIVLWIGVQRKFEKDIQKYKTLISEILEYQRI
ncbi:hypothetical protein [Maribacter hydrothermalis]|uniref:DUF423 domain-containing protein n=1 Tax=Maribacter hydrothermalis TaxID=1836467 RepID=A0A1B7ZFP6_9FLAO|nr:hypothetical protein [Maribacter hydrothermalis]APQ17916.1 hypothetical protein BTR34_11520 [Maribacter hydrothermalis]OBR42387.1 hypothetical protein A9200_03135 [Maribacter hydrothermalis]